MAQRPTKIPPAVEALFAPIAAAFGDMLKKSASAAFDTALAEVQDRVDEVSSRIGHARKKVRRAGTKAAKPAPADFEGEVVEAPSRVRRRPRRAR